MEMSDPQAWTMIGIFAMAMLGGMTLMTTQFIRVLRAEIGALRAETRAGFDVVTVRLDSLDTRLTRVEGKVDDLDTELTNLATRFWRSQ